jgi:hypothetical protein
VKGIDTFGKHKRSQDFHLLVELGEEMVLDIATLGARRLDNRAHQGDFLFVRRDSPLMADTAWS